MAARGRRGGGEEEDAAEDAESVGGLEALDAEIGGGVAMTPEKEGRAPEDKGAPEKPDFRSLEAEGMVARTGMWEWTGM